MFSHAQPVILICSIGQPLKMADLTSTCGFYPPIPLPSTCSQAAYVKGSCSSDQLKPEPPTLPGSYAFHPEVFCLVVLFLGLPALIGHHCKACNRPSRQGSSDTQTPSLNKCLLTLDPSQGSSTGPVPRPQPDLEVSVRIANEGHRREVAPGRFFWELSK